jgi:tryptophan synthase alpha chain
VTVQEASQRALAGGATPTSILADVARLDVDVPLVVMTYYNVVHHAGHERFAASLVDAGVAGAIVPDLPLDELATSGGWGDVADAAGIETVLLAAPTTPDERMARICAGQRDTLAERALDTGRRLKAATDLPVLVGVGISNSQQAVTACGVADGVIVGSALMARVLRTQDAARVDAAYAFVSELRAALDERRR